ncbi:hypothetical protein FDX14_16595 [Citrobacter sp. wls710]|uniref:hypothetical protein n=1 Tax=Citrobacter sp. wls710 TaxID=2576426 RepID=UPI0010C950E2|nr:hypothetical protein [Citrobacter sp. wls710]TKU71491.1 hypothetical protein FDX14_16595 [Citrobacter sp. wls710]
MTHTNFGQNVQEACIVNGVPHKSTWAGFQANGLTGKIWSHRCTYWRTKTLKREGKATYTHPETSMTLHCELISLERYHELTEGGQAKWQH